MSALPIVQPLLAAADLSSGQALRRPGLALWLWRGWLGSVERRELWGHLLESITWEQPTVRVYGRIHPVPRQVAWYGDPGCSYRYSGLLHEPRPWTPVLAELRLRLRQRLGLDLNSLLLNRYRSGADRMGWHADDEPELDPLHPIVSLSLGASRDLRFRPRLLRHGPPPEELPAPFNLRLNDGDLLLMEPTTQRHWLHALPPRRGVAQERFNLTFRRIRLC